MEPKEEIGFIRTDTHNAAGRLKRVAVREGLRSEAKEGELFSPHPDQSGAAIRVAELEDAARELREANAEAERIRAASPEPDGPKSVVPVFARQPYADAMAFSDEDKANAERLLAEAADRDNQAAAELAESEAPPVD